MRKHRDQHLKTVVIQFKPAIGKNSCYVQGVKMNGTPQDTLYKLLGKPIAKQDYCEDFTMPGTAELLDNSYVWIFCERNTLISLWFDFDGFSDNYNKKLCLKWQYKGKPYLLDDTFSPESLQASYPEVQTVRDRRCFLTCEQSFELCDSSIEVFFVNDRITRVKLSQEAHGR